MSENPDILLQEVFEHISTYCVLPSDGHVLAVVLWAAHTHFIQQLDSTPRLSLQSPDKQSGKTRLLEVMQPLLRDPLNIVNMTPAVMFRAIEQWQPTFIIDEIDAFFPKGMRSVDQAKEDIRGMINAGHRRGQTVMRVSQKDHDKLDRFHVFCPVVLAGISSLPDTIEDRAVILHMRRRRPEEEIAPYRQSLDDPKGAALGARLKAWAESADLPQLDAGDMSLEDRPADVWEPLYRVAKLAGGAWLGLLDKNAENIRNMGRVQNDDNRVELLRDIRIIMQKDDSRGMHTAQLVAKLNNIQDSPWQYMENGRGLNAWSMSGMLKEYGIKPGQLKIKGLNNNGYRWADFEDSMARYLTAENEHSGGAGRNWQQMIQDARDAGEDV